MNAETTRIRIRDHMFKKIGNGVEFVLDHMEAFFIGMRSRGSQWLIKRHFDAIEKIVKDHLYDIDSDIQDDPHHYEAKVYLGSILFILSRTRKYDEIIIYNTYTREHYRGVRLQINRIISDDKDYRYSTSREYHNRDSTSMSRIRELIRGDQ